MAIWKKAAALPAIVFAVLLSVSPAGADSHDDYVGGNPPCVDDEGNPVPDDECELSEEEENPCVPGNPDSGSGIDTDGDGTPDECDETAVGIDTGAPGGGESGAPGGAEGDELGSGQENPGEASTGGVGEAEAGGAETGAAGGAQTASSGSLPVTGGDVVALAVIGAVAVAAGTVLVRRSRRTGSTAA